MVSYRKLIGRPIIFLKKAVRKALFYLIQPIVDEQNQFNSETTATVNEMYNCHMTALGEIQHLQGSLSVLQRDVSDLQGLADPKALQEGQQNDYTALDYEDFENHFRGPREDIKKAQSVYLKYFEGQDNVLDLGCGRGEFMELCQENGIYATGIELYDKFVDYCKECGLNVVEGDAIEYLENCPDSSVGGLFISQLVEHLPLTLLVRLCNLAYSKLKSGSYVIMETPNPMSLAIYRNCFYIDPSHNKPVHPYTLDYLLRKAGFNDTDTVFTESSRTHEKVPHLVSETIENLEEFNAGMDRLTDLMFGSQDYAVIAKKD